MLKEEFIKMKEKIVNDFRHRSLELHVEMKVFITDSVKVSRFGISHYHELIGQLQNGLEIYINNYDYDLQSYLGCYVEMLLCVTRSPYLEKGIKRQLFLPDKYYSIELIDELLKKKNQSPGTNEKELRLTGEYIDSYILSEEWICLIKSKFFRSLLKEPSALRTEDGIFLLSPVHLEKRIPIKGFPQKVTITTGCIDLAAWHPL